jgi:hypothetical protein
MDWETATNLIPWELLISLVATLFTGYFGWRLRALKKVFKEAQEFLNTLDIATRPDSEGGEKVTIAEGKRIAYEGKDVILALKELFAKTHA